MIEKLPNGKIRLHRDGNTYLYNSIKEYRLDTPMQKHGDLTCSEEWGPKCGKKSKISQTA